MALVVALALALVVVGAGEAGPGAAAVGLAKLGCSADGVLGVLGVGLED